MEVTKNTNKVFRKFLHQVGVGLGFLFKNIAKILLFILRFLIFLLDLTLLLASDLIEKYILGNWKWYTLYCKRQKEKMYQIQVISNGTKHEYTMNRGTEFDKLYKGFLGKVDVTGRGKTLILDEDISKDIIQKVNRMVFLVEKNGIREGYKFGRNSRSNIDEEEIYNEYITEQVRKGL